MKILIEESGNLFNDLIPKELSIEAETEYKKLHIIEDLLELMSQNGISKAELAKRTGMLPSRITAILSGRNNLTIGTIVKLSQAIGAELHQTLLPKTHEVAWTLQNNCLVTEIRAPERLKTVDEKIELNGQLADNDEPNAA